MTTISDLIARLEAAKEGSRELDIAILTKVIGFRRVAENLFYGPKPAEWTYTLDGDGHPALPSPTRSLDAALTLKPDSCPWWRVGKVQDEHSPLRAFGHGKSYTAEVGLNWGDAPKIGHAYTAPLALCIAALKTREARR